MLLLIYTLDRSLYHMVSLLCLLCLHQSLLGSGSQQRSLCPHHCRLLTISQLAPKCKLSTNWLQSHVTTNSQNQQCMSSIFTTLHVGILHTLLSSVWFLVDTYYLHFTCNCSTYVCTIYTRPLTVQAWHSRSCPDACSLLQWLPSYLNGHMLEHRQA